MKKALVRKVASTVMGAALVMSSMVGCSSTNSSTNSSASNNTSTSNDTQETSSSSNNSPYAETITVDVFDSQANYQGTQPGWFAKIVKDRFNMELNFISPNVAGGGDTLYQTRSANGNLGDLIITNLDKSRLKDLVTAGLVMDMTDYIGNCENLQQYQEAIKQASALAEQDGIWAVPSEISSNPATEPCEALEATNAPSLRWDLYGKVGYPKINTLDDLLTVLKDMQDNAEVTSTGKQPYALSLFRDWDGDMLQNAEGITGLYGYKGMGFCMEKVDGSDIQSLIDNDGIYVKALQFLFDANQMGILDPESTTQNFDNVKAKYKDGAILYSLWPWLGAGDYNLSENTEQGKGFQTAIIEDMQCLSYGSMPLGKMEVGVMVGSQAKDPQRLVDFIDWLYSPEGIQMAAASNCCGPEGLTWEMKDGKPALTDFGVQAFVDKTKNLPVPEEWGGGTWEEGASYLNLKPVGVVDADPNTGVCYNYQRWEDYQNRIATKLTEDWSAHNDNALTGIERLQSTNHLLVIPGTNYATPEYSTDILTIKEQCKQSIVEYSWKMVFASDQAAFDGYLKEMQDTVIGLGYNDVLAVDEQNCKDLFKAYDEAKVASK